MSSPFLRTSALLMLALGVAACADTTAPVLEIDRPPPSVLLRAGTAFDLELGVSDALERVVPALEQSQQVEAVKTSLKKLASTLQSRQTPLLAMSTRSFKEALDAYFAAQPSGSFDPDAAVLKLLSEDLEAVALFPPLDTLRTN